MKNKKILALSMIALIFVFSWSVDVLAQEDSVIPVQIETGSFLTLRIDNQLKAREIFPLDLEELEPLKYGFHIGMYDQCESDVDNLRPEARELGTVVHSNEIHYDLRFAIENARAEKLRLAADHVKVQLAYTEPDGTDGLWEKELPFPAIDFYLRGSGVEIPSYSGESFVTRDSLEVVSYGFYPVDDERMQLRFYFLGDKTVPGGCYVKGEIAEEKEIHYSFTCEDHIIGQGALRSNNYLEINFDPGEFPVEARMKEVKFLMVDPTISGEFRKADGDSVERIVRFGNDILVTFYAEFGSSGSNRCLNYVIE